MATQTYAPTRPGELKRTFDTRLRKGFVTEGFRRENTRSGLVSMAHLVTIARPALATVAEYDQWLASALSVDPRGRTKLTGAKLRRAVQMRQAGQGLTAIGRAIGMDGSWVGQWLKRLPEGLAA